MKRTILLIIGLIAAACYDPKPAKKDVPKKAPVAKQGPNKYK
jgi:hypothetical protein